MTKVGEDFKRDPVGEIHRLELAAERGDEKAVVVGRFRLNKGELVEENEVVAFESEPGRYTAVFKPLKTVPPSEHITQNIYVGNGTTAQEAAQNLVNFYIESNKLNNIKDHVFKVLNNPSPIL